MDDPLGGATPGRRVLRTVHLYLLLPWVAIVVAGRQPIRDNSFLWHIRAGTLQLDSGQVLTTDPFTFTFGGQSWRTQSWLADVLYGVLERHLGHELTWVSWLNVVVFGAAVALTGWLAWRVSGSSYATAVTLIGLAWIAISYVNPRPVAFSFLLLAVLAIALEGKQRWALPLIVWVWAALHGSFILGIGLMVLDGLRRRDRRRVADVLLSFVTASLTAHSLGLWWVLVRFSESREALALITEWRPPDLTRLTMVPYALMILVVLIGAARRALSPRDMWVIAPFLLFGLTSSRAVIVAAFVLAPFVSRVLAVFVQSWETTGGETRTPNRVLLGLVGAAILTLPFVLVPEASVVDETRFPVAAAAALERVPTYHSDVAGGYLIFEHWPDLPVFVDDRAELYSADFFTGFVDARFGRPGWDEFLAEWQIEQALVGTDDPLGELLALAGWTEVHRDDVYVVYRDR